jgi:hypothetical protein
MLRAASPSGAGSLAGRDGSSTFIDEAEIEFELNQVHPYR